MGFLAIADPVVNTVAMMFMTPYYADEKYYRKWCCLCIKCCDKEARESKEIFDDEPDGKNELEPTQTQTVTQTDTIVTIGTQTLTSTDLTTTATTKSSFQSQLNDNLSTNVSSIDTMSQLRVIGRNFRITNNNSNTQNQMDMHMAISNGVATEEPTPLPPIEDQVIQHQITDCSEEA